MLYDMKFISTLIISKLKSPTKVALTCLQIPTVLKNTIMKYIDSKPPHLWIKLLSKSKFIGFHPFFEKYKKTNSLSFIIYKNEKLIRFTW
jgi:hypothetical protein